MVLKEEDLPVYKYEGPYVLIDKESDVKPAVQELKKSKLLGFDTESKPAFIRRTKSIPALIQLANEGAVFLFRICNYGITQDIADILQSKEILKTGVGVIEDCKGLRRCRSNLSTAGFLDIAMIANSRGFISKGLRGLTIEILHKRLWKPKAPAVSNWEKDILTEGQKRYSANDGMISRDLGMEILKGKTGWRDS